MSENAGTPEYIMTVKIHLFHAVGGQFQAEVPEIGRFRGYDLATALANVMQATLYTVYEEQKRLELLRPGQPL